MTAPNPVALPLRLLEASVVEFEQRGRAAFEAAHGDPVLLVNLSQAPLDDGALRTMAISAANRGPALETAVFPIAKRSADAFTTFIWLGRAAQCDVVLPFETISKLQAQFVRRPDGGLQLLDAGSSNGTFLGDTRLEKNKPVLLTDNAQLRFGKIKARFCLPLSFAAEVELMVRSRRPAP